MYLILEMDDKIYEEVTIKIIYLSIGSVTHSNPFQPTLNPIKCTTIL